MAFTACPPPIPTTPCSGRGVLVNYTQPSSGVTLQLCSCEAWWGDGGDVFDGRIAWSNSSGWLTQDCRVSNIGQYVIFSVALFVAILRAVQLTKALMIVHSRRKAKSISQVVGQMAYRVLIIELVYGTANFMGVALLKLVYLQVVGTDIGITICLCNTILSYNIAHADLTIYEFRLIVNRAVLRTEAGRKILLAHRLVVLGGDCVYYMLVLIPTYILLSLDKTHGPTCNASWVILLLRNGGVLFWQLASVIGNMALRNAIASAAISLATSQHNSKAETVVRALNDEIKRTITTGTIACILYTVWMLPWLWSQQWFLIGFVTSISATRHPGRHVINKTSNKESSSAAVVVSA